MTLYLKYRPSAFTDVVGQDHIVTTLENAVKQDRIAHAYLFCGTRGTGKTSIARILAKTILTRGTQDEAIRRQIEESVRDGSLVDLIEIDAASTRGIDDIRDLIDKIQFAPVVAKAKVYIIDEVHMLTKEAFNALLKTLEEPPEYAYFILATTETHKVPDTIQSRCQRFPFRRVKEEDLVRRLQYIADQERISVDRTALRMIAEHATGSFRDAISLLDQVRSLPKITAEDIRERTGETGEELLRTLFEIVERKETARIPEIVERIEEDGVPLDRVIRQMLGVLRERMHERIARNEEIAGYVRMLDRLLEGLKDLRLSPVPGLVLETVLLSLCTDASASDIGAHASSAVAETGTKPPPKKQEERPAPPPSAAPPPPPAAPAAQTARPEPAKPGLVEAPDLTVEAINGEWSSLLSQITTPSVRMSLKNGSVANVSGEKVIVSFASSFHRDKVAATDASRMVEAILEKIFKRTIRMECVLEEASGAGNEDERSGAADLAEAAEEVFGPHG